MERVAVGVCTYRRPEQLRRLLESLTALRYPRDQLCVIVVDNDPARSALPVVASFEGRVPNLSYEPEPVRLISAARNRLAAAALASGVSYVAFVDDDEWVPPDWLRELVATAESLAADAVAGPVLPVYEDGVPEWVVEGGFFLRERFPTGQLVRGHGIGNVLVRSDWLARIKPPFGERFRLPGGEDTYFLLQLERAGACIYWCDEAVLYEWVPRDRASSAWLIRRSYLMGSAFSECLRRSDFGVARQVTRACKCQVRVIQGFIETLWAAFRGRAALVSAICRVSGGIGGLRGLLVRTVPVRDAQ